MKSLLTKQKAALGCRALCFLALLLLATSNPLSAQGLPVTNDSTTFAQMRQHFENYWVGKTPEKGSGWKVYQRWEWFWEPRQMPDGRLPPAGYNDQQYQAYLEKVQQPQAESMNVANWTSEGPSSSTSGYYGLGRVNCMAFHPSNTSIMWAGTPAGGLWKTTNGGTSWTQLTDNNTAVMGVSGIAVDPTDPNIIYIATGDGDGGDTYSVGVLKTTDGGTTWNTTGLNFSLNLGRLINQLIINPTNPAILLAATSNGLYRTTNSGANWTQVLTSRFYDVRFKPGDPNTVYACRGGELFYSTNGGSSFTSAQTISGSGRLALAVSPANPNMVAAVSSKSSDNSFNGLYTSSNSGVNYTLKSTTPNLLNGSSSGSGTGGQGWYDLCIAISPTDSNSIIVGGVNLWRSANGGTNWSLVNYWNNGAPPGVAVVHADKHFLGWRDNTTLFQGCDGGVYRSQNNGTNWTDLSNSLVISQMYRLGTSQSDTKAICGLQDNGTKLRGTGGGWTENIGGDGMDCTIHPTNSNIMYGEYQYGKLQRSTNGGNTWTDINQNIPGAPDGAWVTPIALVSNGTLYAAYKDVYKTTNQGAAWTAISTNLSPSTNMTLLAVAPTDNNVIYAGTSSVIYKTINGGSSWSTVTGNLPTNPNIQSLTVDLADPNKVYVTLGGYVTGQKVYRSTVGGTTWTNISGTLPNLPANCLAIQSGGNDALYVGMDVGVYYRNGTMNDWTLFQTGLPNVPVLDLEIRASTNIIRAATFGRGLWQSSAEPVDNLVVSPSNQSVPYTAGSAAFSVNTALSWTAADDQPWLTLAPPSGTGTGMVTATYTENTGPASRIDTITVTAGALTRKVTVTQAGTPPAGCTNVYEPENNACNGSTPAIPAGADFYAQIGFANDDDYYKFTVTGGTRVVTLSLSNLPANYNLQLLDNSCNVLVSSAAAGTASEYIESILSEGTYHVRVYGNAGAFDAALCYTLRVDTSVDPGACSDSFEPDNNALATAPEQPVNSYTYSRISSTTDVDNWKFIVPATGAVNLRLYNLVVDFDLELLNSGGTVIGGSYQANNTSESITGVLSAGTYYARVFGYNGANSTTCYMLKLSRITASAAVTNASCNGGANGSIQLTASGGTPPYTYAWSNGQTGATAINLAAGTYTATVTDVTGLTATATATVTQPAAFAISPTTTNATCFGGLTGSVSLSVSGGLAPYTYNWSNGQTTAAAINLAAGTYTATVTDANGCSSTSSATVTQPTALDLSTSTINVACFGGQAGSVALSVSGGTAPYTYGWNNGQTTATAINLAAGTYTATVTDGNGCTSTNSATVTQPAALAISTMAANVVCFGSATGSVSLSVGGGTAPYTYDWSNGQTAAAAINLAAGTYTATVTDANGCTSTNSAAVAQPAALAITPTTTNVACFGGQAGSVALSTGGGTAPYTYAWNNGQTAATATNLPAGTYTATVTDANGCTSTNSSTITQPAALAIDASSTNATCFGNQTGSVALNVSGGTTPYSYAWSNGQTAATAINLPAGTYTATVTDANSCTSTSVSTVTQPTALAITPTTTNVACFGGQAGSVALSVSGGTTPYSYVWSSGQTTAVANNLPAGTYTATVTDANGCNSTNSSTVAQPAELAISPTTTNAACFGSPTGSVALGVSGGTAPYTYAWNNGQTTAEATNLPAATYMATVTDANGCSSTASMTVTEPDALAVSPSATNATCNGNATGSAAVSVSGGTAPYTYTWNNGQTTATAINLAAGTYTATTTDANGCSSTGSATVTEPAVLAVSPSGTNLTCNGNASGSIALSVTGGAAPYSYAWSNGQTVATATNLSAGAYTATVTDANGCTATGVAVLTEPVALVINQTVTPVACFGGQNGTVALNVSGGTAPYTYAWNNGQTAATATALAAGVYTTTVTDAGGCTSTSSTSVTQPAAVSVNKTITNVACFGGANGSVVFSVSGGTAPYAYAWSNGQGGATVGGLAAGTYTTTVTDAIGCSTVSVSNITQPAVLAIAKTVTNVACFGSQAGSVAITVSGGTAPYAYAWSNGQGAATATGLAAGAYTATVTDAAGCSMTSSSTITQPTVLAVGKSVTNVPCFGDQAGSIALNVSGGTAPYTYAWSNGAGAATLTGLAAGSYTATVTDAAGCSTTSTASVTQPAVLAITNTTTNMLCFGGQTGSVALNVSGGTAPYTYGWSNGQTAATAVNLAAGTYTATVTDANGCTSTSSMNVSQPTALSVAKTVTNVTCNGSPTGSVALNVSGGTAPYTYGWNNGQTAATAVNLAAGTYTATVTDGNGCTSTNSTSVTQQAALSFIKTITNVACNGDQTGAVALNVSGGTAPYTYGWNNGQTASTAVNLTAGTYTTTVTDATGCTSTSSTSVTQPAALSIAKTTTNAACFGSATGSVALTVSGGTAPYTYNWNTGQTAATAINLVAGTYTATVSDANGCTSTSSSGVTQPAALSIAKTTINAACFGSATGSVALTVSGGTAPYTYNWNNGQTAATANNLPAGTYTATVSDANGCTSTSTSGVTQPAALSVAKTTANVACFGGQAGSVALTVSGGTSPYTYNWNNGQTTATANNLPAGTYTATVTDANGCTSTNSTSVLQPAALAITYMAAPADCPGSATGSVALTVSGGTSPYTYNWNNSQTAATATNLAAGTYTATVTDANGCTSTSSTNITQPAALSILPMTTNAACFGSATGSVALTVSGGTSPYTYNWNNSQTAAAATNLPAGTYTATVTDANGCTSTSSTSVEQPAALSILQTTTNAACFGSATGSVALAASGGTSPYTYNWNNGQTAAAATNLPAGTYTATVTDTQGCTSTRSTTLTQPEPLALGTTVTNESCAAGADGAVALSAGGGTAPYAYSWSNGQTAATATGLTAATYSVTATDANNCTAAASATVGFGLPNELYAQAAIKVLLQGPYVAAAQLMHDSLRVKNLIPLTEPYTGLTGFTHTGGGAEQTTPAVLAITGLDAVVDWIFLELRGSANPAQVLATRSALVQRDGDVVDMDGISPVSFSVLASQSFFITVRHRNHLGVQLGAAVFYPDCDPLETDFTTTPPEGFYDFNGLNPAQKTVSGVFTLWAGNGRTDFQLKYNGSNNDRTTVLAVVGLATPNAVVPGYNLNDYNLDGLVKYNGSANDRNVLLGNVGIVTPSAVVHDQTAR